MHSYSYTAKDGQGKTVRGIANAEDEMGLANKISRLGYFLIKSKISAEQTSPAKIKSNIPRLKPKDVLNLTIYLAAMLDSGIPLAHSMLSLSQNAEKEDIRKAAEDIRSRIESGFSMKDALLAHP